MHRFALALATCSSLLGGQAAALSCMQPDVAASFTQAAEAEELYVVLLGTFTFGDVPTSDTGDINFPREVEVSSRFDGKFLSGNGFTDAPPLDVTIRFSCAGPWCGSLQSDGSQVLAFVEQRNDEYLLSVEPCFGTAFVNPTDAQQAQAVSCMRGRDCTPNF